MEIKINNIVVWELNSNFDCLYDEYQNKLRKYVDTDKENAMIYNPATWEWSRFSKDIDPDMLTSILSEMSNFYKPKKPINVWDVEYLVRCWNSLNNEEKTDYLRRYSTFYMLSDGQIEFANENAQKCMEDNWWVLDGFKKWLLNKIKWLLNKVIF